MKLEDKIQESSSIKSFMKTADVIWYLIILSTEAVTAIMIFTISQDFYPWIYLRNVFALVFVLFLPGYSFTKAVFPIYKSPKVINREVKKIESIALSIGMSLAIVSLIGLLLYYSPWGIGLNSIVFSLIVFTSSFATISLFRNYQKKNLV